MTRIAPARPWRIALAGVAATALVACGRAAPEAPAPSNTTAPAAASASDAGRAASAIGAAASASAGPPVSVTTVRAQQRDVPVDVETTGAVTAVTSVDIKPQTTSAVTQVHVRDGQFVKRGERLITLDSRSDEANVAKLRAQLARDQVSLADAQRQHVRNRELLAMNFVSQSAVDSSQALVDAQAAAVAADRAALDAAQVALSYSRIDAPMAGRLGVVAVSVGSSVTANQTTLVTITQIDPVDVSFSLPQRYLGDVLSALASGTAAVDATLPDGQGSLRGRLSFVDNAIDTSTGTVKAKARFDNRSSMLWPGAFVKVTLTLRTLKDSVVVPFASVIQSQRGPFVYAVVDGRAVARPLEVVATRGDDAAVRGVRVGEAIVLDGRQNLRPGSAVVERARDAAVKPPRPDKPASGAAGASSGSAP
jgi:RND family efflux transporter MFP subunit